MSKQFINYKGEIIPADQAVMGINNRGFRYGDGLFESMRLLNGEVKFADLHAERLQKGMKGLKMDGAETFSSNFLKEKVDELAKRNKTGANGRVRITVFRDGDGLYTPSSNKFGYAIEVNKTDEHAYKSNHKGLIVDIYDEMPKPINVLSNFKTCNSLPFVMAGLFKLQHSLDEVLLINQNGFLCEAMTSNLFVVYEKQLYTPALSEGCIAGVMRSVVISLAEENNIPVIEAQINPAILNEADEVFVTNASRGIQWVMGYGKRRYFNELSKLLLGMLNEKTSSYSS